MTVSLRHLPLTITQKNLFDYYTVWLSQNHSIEQIITTACTVYFNRKKINKNLKRENQRNKAGKTSIHTKPHPHWTFKEALLKYQKKNFPLP